MIAYLKVLLLLLLLSGILLHEVGAFVESCEQVLDGRDAGDLAMNLHSDVLARFGGFYHLVEVT